jgi:hypothetical protein
MWFRHRRERLSALEREVERQGKQIARNSAVLKAQGCRSGPPPAEDLRELAAGQGERAGIVHAAGRKLILVLGEGEADPQDLEDAVRHLDGHVPSPRDGLAS